MSQLEKVVEEVRRRGKRQAAPFSKGPPKQQPKRPGRKAGVDYGAQVVRPVPEKTDETIEVDCPLWCPDCEGRVRLTGKKSQYQIDLPEIHPQTTEFIVHYGHCESCGKPVQGRHARQISDALDVGRVQLGPGVISFAASPSWHMIRLPCESDSRAQESMGPPKFFDAPLHVCHVLMTPAGLRNLTESIPLRGLLVSVSDRRLQCSLTAKLSVNFSCGLPLIT